MSTVTFDKGRQILEHIKLFKWRGFYFKEVCCLPSGIAYKTIGFEGLIKGTSHLKYPFLSSCKTSPRCKFRMLESPMAAVSLFVHGLSTSRKSSPSSSCNQKLQTQSSNHNLQTKMWHSFTYVNQYT